MRIAVTGATGLLGRHVVRHLISLGHNCRCWLREATRIGDLKDQVWLEWIPGQLGRGTDARSLVKGCDALVHCAVQGPASSSTSGPAGSMADAIKNVVGTLTLFEAARSVGIRRIVTLSSTAVFGEICSDRFLDEAHPLWPSSTFGAGKAALEQFVHALGTEPGSKVEIASLRPSPVYGPASPLSKSRWYPLVASIVRGEEVTVEGGEMVVHAADVARAVERILFLSDASKISGRSFNCTDRYVSNFELATLAKELSGSPSILHGREAKNHHPLITGRLTALGMDFGGTPLLRQSVSAMIARIRAGE